MKIRTQLALAFLLLAIVPMTAIVLYSYISSLRTVHQAVEAEAEVLTADMETRMGQIRGEIRRRIERVGAFPFRRWAQEGETEQKREAFYNLVMAELGETAPLVERFEFVPEWPGANPEPASAPDPGELHPPQDQPPPPPRYAPIIVDMREMLKVVEASIEDLHPKLIPGTDREVLMEKARQGLESMQKKVAHFNLKTRHVIEIRAETRVAPRIGAWVMSKGDADYRLLFSSEVEVPVYEDGAVVGEIRAQVKNEELLRRVLERTRRNRGEIPFAIDRAGRLHTATDEDHVTLTDVGLEEPVHPETLADRRIFDNWVVVTSQDEATGLTFGIAKPMQESLAEMRATAIRNFSFGTGLIGLALLGVIPLSRRMTYGLNLLTEGARRVAAGDLEARVSFRSKSEIGQLARAFNNMAGDLRDNQEKLLESERLQADLDRKTEELEEARRFQLSLLPKILPEHPAFDLAAVMKTATEVGGDYYDFRVADDGTLTIAIGDATGHGAKAGTMVTVIKSLFSAYPPEDDLAQFHTKAASAIKQMALGRMSMALTLARLTDRKLTVSAAGMPPVLIHRAATGEIEEIAIEGMPLGALEFPYRELSVEVFSGDVLLFMSDGFPELPNPEGDTLGYERASDHFADAGSNPNEVIRHLLESAKSWAGEASPADDITFVVIRIR